MVTLFTTLNHHITHSALEHWHYLEVPNLQEADSNLHWSGIPDSKTAIELGDNLHTNVQSVTGSLVDEAHCGIVLTGLKRAVDFNCDLVCDTFMFNKAI